MASMIIVVIGLASLWSAAAFGKAAPFWYWTASDAGRGLVRANLQVGFQLSHHTTITSAVCKGNGASLTRQHRFASTACSIARRKCTTTSQFETTLSRSRS
jgi:hypothetical protein